MQIAVLSGSADTLSSEARGDTMQWFETIFRAALLALIVLVGAAVVRNVTDALTAATVGPATQQTASLAPNP
jgi:hypothetical protein